MSKRNLWVILISVVASMAITTAAFASYFTLTKSVPATANIVAATVLDPDLLGLYKDAACTQTLASLAFEAPPGGNDSVGCYLKNKSQQTLYMKVSDDFASGNVTMTGLAPNQALVPAAVSAIIVTLQVYSSATVGQRSFNVIFDAHSQPWGTPVYSTVKLKIASPWATSQRFLQAAIKWTEEITEATNGSVTFETYWGGSLATPSDTLNLLSSRAVDMVCTHPWYSPGQLPLACFDYSFPFGPNDPELLVRAYRQMREEFPQFEDELLDNNGLLIMTMPSDTYNLLSRTPKTSIDDLQGKKIAAIGRFFGRWVGEPLGAISLVAQITERYTCLQTGLEDVDLLNPTMWVAYKLYEQAKYLVDVPLGAYFGTGQLWINKDSFAALTPDTQSLFLDMGLQLEQLWYPGFIASEEQNALNTMALNGVSTFHISAAEKIEWASKVPDTAAELAAELETAGYPGWDIVRRWQEITAGLGFEWARQWGIQP